MSKQDTKKEGGGGASYFQNSKNTELSELQNELNTMKVDIQKDAMKQIIASMTIGKDVSSLFPHVVKCMRTTNVELKKLIYLYIINYAKVKPDTTLLAVNAFHTDATDKNSPLIRALAVRTMGCIRVNMIVTYLCETLKLSLKDEDAYVRKTACICVAKLYSTCPGLVRENGFIDTLLNLLLDGNAVVVANAMVALNEISILSGQNLLNLKNKMLKRVLSALNESNEWGQVFILDALINYVPKKDNYSEDIIDSVIPRLNHENPAVVMSAVKVILKFLDKISNTETAKTYCKKVSNCLMSVMKCSPEIQYVLLRSLHAVVQKRPNLLEKEYKNFIVNYNDPIYIKLEKIDILYKLTDYKNYESCINELKNTALMEVDVELVRKAIRYMGFIAFKIEKSLPVCVEAMKDILDQSQEFTLSESLIVSRDLMRKYKGQALDLLKKITPDLLKNSMEADAKCALLYIIGEFCYKLTDSTSMIKSFVETFKEENDSVKLQILNAVIKNFVNKPDETEELVKEALQKGGQETENPDVRDRAFIYWRLLESDPDLAKDMIMGEKPSFEYTEEKTIDIALCDDIIENMTNMSAVYHQLSKELILKEDMINDPDAEVDIDQDKKEKAEIIEDKGPKKEKKMIEQKVNIIDQDLLGLDDNAQEVVEHNNNIISQMGIFDEIFPGFKNDQNQNSTKSNSQTSSIPFDPFDFTQGQAIGTPSSVNDNDFGFEFGGDSSSSSNNYDDNIQGLKLNPNSNRPPTLVHSANKNNQNGNKGVSIYANFYRNNTSPVLGIAIKNSSNSNLQVKSINLASNSFGIYPQEAFSFSISQNSNQVKTVVLVVDNNRSNGKPPSDNYEIQATITTSIGDFVLDIPFNINCMFSAGGKITNQQEFAAFFKQHNSTKLKGVVDLRSDISNEIQLNKCLESINVFTVCKNSKVDPIIYYYSCSVNGEMYVVYEASFVGSKLNLNVMAANSIIEKLCKESVESLLSS